MSSFVGEVGSKVVMTKGREFHDKIIPKGTIMKIQNNSIDEDGDIKLTSLDGTLKNVYVDHQYVEVWSGNEWKFKVPVFCEIDFKLMSKDLNKKEPLMLVNVSTGNRIVLVHSSLLMKAKKLGIKKPKGEKLYRGNRNILVIESQFSEWVDWAKEVKLAKWKNKPKYGIKVKVSIPKV